VGYLIKALTLGLLGLLAFFCRTRTKDRRDVRFLAEFSLVVLTMLFVSERSWKHHFVTLLLPYTYLVAELYAPGRRPGPRFGIGLLLVLSCVLMATTSSEVGGFFVGGRGHEIAQGYGMFLWAAVALYVGVAWRLRRASGPAPVLSEAEGRPSPPAPHVAHRKEISDQYQAG
jgi:hypothetical protein